MAYIIKGSGAAVGEPLSMLAKSADFGRQRDVYILATRYRNKDCIRLWSDFQAEQPSLARLVIRDVENDRRDAAAANWELDQRLQKAEKVVTKGRKVKSVTKGRKKASPGLRDALKAADEVLRRAELDSCDPHIREMAAAVYRGRGLAG